MSPKKITIDLQTKTVNVKMRSFETDFAIVHGDPIYDCCDDAAEFFGVTRDEYRRQMNTEEGYLELLEMDEN